ncbi:hypothetical protein D9M69_455350 [compost metagenome]
MGIQHSLGITCGPGGVAQGGSPSFVEGRPGELRAFIGDQLFETQQVTHLDGRHAAPPGHRDKGLHPRQVRGQLLHQCAEGQVEEQDTVFGMPDDELDLLGKQSGIDGVQHGTHAGHRKVELHMSIAVPGQRPDAITRLDAEPGQGVGHLLGSVPHIGIGAMVYRSFDRPRRYLRRRMASECMFEHRGNK